MLRRVAVSRWGENANTTAVCPVGGDVQNRRPLTCNCQTVGGQPEIAQGGEPVLGEFRGDNRQGFAALPDHQGVAPAQVGNRADYRAVGAC